MRILYIAKHGCGGNDDEGAIEYAMKQLGHDVMSVRECDARSIDLAHVKADFALCHHWHDEVSLRQIRMPRVFWCFDRINDPDPSLEPRNRTRMAWARGMAKACDLGFLTDGDWVASEGGKLHWLMQGADERIIGPGAANDFAHDILIPASIANGGDRRRRFISDFKERWGPAVHVVHKGVHGREMANLVAASKIVIAPMHPASDRYWSNRVYQITGFAGFLLHPYCGELHLRGPAVSMYGDEKHLDELISVYLRDKDGRDVRRIASHASVRENHLYRHRVAELVRIVQEKLL